MRQRKLPSASTALRYGVTAALGSRNVPDTLAQLSGGPQLFVVQVELGLPSLPLGQDLLGRGVI